MMRFLSLVLGFVCLVFQVQGRLRSDGTEDKTYEAVGGDADPSYWVNDAREDLQRTMNLKQNRDIAKNLILFIGDGMGVTTVTAGRILKGQLKGRPGEEENLEMDKMPYTGFAKTYTVDRQTADSAAAATAYLSGVKSMYGTIGVDGRVDRYSCASQKGTEAQTILDWAKAAGKSVGIVTTARMTHASPAAAYAHAADRGWEGDSQMGNCGNATLNIPCECKDIARQLIEDNADIEVLFGGGRKFFIPLNDTTDPSSPSTESINGSQRLDQRNLIEEWKQDKANRNLKHAYVNNKGDFDGINPNEVDYALGLFSYSHMDYDLGRDDSDLGQPSIHEMTRKAIQILSKNPKGFFLFVEGARIDHAHHEGTAKRALYDTIAFDNAIGVAKSITRSADTLITVTADHSFSFTVLGYSKRGNDILGVADPISSMDTPTDGFKYSTLMYANGKGFRATRLNLTNEITRADDFKQDATIGMDEAAHGAEDVAIYGSGPMSHMLVGTHEQTYIPHLMAYAACIGAFADTDTAKCRAIIKQEPEYEGPTCGASGFKIATPAILISLYLMQKVLC